MYFIYFLYTSPNIVQRKSEKARWLRQAFVVLAAEVENICTINRTALKQTLLAELHKCRIKYKK